MEHETNLMGNAKSLAKANDMVAAVSGLAVTVGAMHI